MNCGIRDPCTAMLMTDQHNQAPDIAPAGRRRWDTPCTAIATQGFGLSSGMSLPFVVLPSAWAAWNLFSHVLPLVLDKACGNDLHRRTFVVATTCFICLFVVLLWSSC